MIYTLEAISTGKVEDLPYSTKRPMRSALNKKKFAGSMWLSKTGFVEDEQEYKDHGGPNKAVCLYSKKNYSLWEQDVSVLPEYAMFGENITVSDLDEKDVHFGDQFKLGNAVLEVSEIREPCWKIQEKYKIPNLIKRMSTSGKTGFYFRVLKEGYVQEDSNLELIKQANNETLLSVFDLNQIYYIDNKNIERLTYALKNPYLTEERISKLERFLTRAEKAKK
ncbi:MULTISPECIES: MOSC domain-containing protein [Staphylococcus]|uniref:MOSC domain-containing protein n=1 Tax=Staphylococcus xylosus TaxID=1288 RepID=A0A418IS57_STAXY|nr:MULTISPECIES: MOSC domain-containing protein [Staphylococcus]MDW8542852.1 MOSC domain-containing protein [Staphylococcus sp. KG4-1]MRF35514.1 MOSC domain-containing protein [Staphylococcus sp. KY49P]MDW8562265.1 MOSC domain-containing protein [Staphylococcus sp. KG4-3]NQD99347.1 MOSC domain-containing protein [Staphylococcus xylosus]PTI06547.1 MOSC domain-containing protein [Staphylococcus xylosus]